MRLRRTARRLQGCLGALPDFVRKVIVLRFGIHGAPHSRRAVAERLDVSVGRVRHAERSGLRSLRQVDSDFACGARGGAGGPGGVGVAISSVGFADPAPATRVASNESDEAGSAADRSAVKGVTQSSRPEEKTADFGFGSTVLPAESNSDDANFPLTFVLLGGLALMALMSAIGYDERKRRLGLAPDASGATPDEGERGLESEPR